MDRFFGPEDGGAATREFAPRTDVVETDEGWEISVELPGLKPEDVHVELCEGALCISGEKKEEKEEKGKTFHRLERRWGGFRRVIPLMGAVEEGKIEARFTDGVLKVTLPKIPAAKPKAIEVKA